MRELKMKWMVLGLLFINVAHADLDRNRAYPTYSASANIVVAPNATDICKISGSTKTIRIHSVEVIGNQTTGGTNNFLLVKRSSDNSGATLQPMNAIKFDSGHPAASASTVGYTSNPTSLGTLVGVYKQFYEFNAQTASFSAPSSGLYEFNDSYGIPITLHGANEVLAVNFNGSTVPAGLTVDCNFEWTEYSE